jgi:hypothetical protein
MQNPNLPFTLLLTFSLLACGASREQRENAPDASVGGNGGATDTAPAYNLAGGGNVNSLAGASGVQPVTVGGGSSTGSRGSDALGGGGGQTSAETGGDAFGGYGSQVVSVGGGSGTGIDTGGADALGGGGGQISAGTGGDAFGGNGGALGTGAARLLDGMPNELALGAVRDFFDPEPVSDAEVTEGIIRTRLIVLFKPDATCAEVNAALSAVRGSITEMTLGGPLLAIRIPDPGSLEELLRVRKVLASGRGVLLVSLDPAAQLLELPSNDSFRTDPNDSLFDHHLSLRAHGAWNARALLDRSTYPILAIADVFGTSPESAMGPNGLWFEVEEPSDFRHAGTESHGLKVLSLYGASFGGDDSAPGRATGMLPAGGLADAEGPRTLLRVADLDGTGVLGWRQILTRVYKLIREIKGKHPDRRFLLNASVGIKDANGDLARKALPCLAFTWVTYVRSFWQSIGQPDYEGDFLTLAAAGNDPKVGARDFSPFNYANGRLNQQIQAFTSECEPIHQLNGDPYYVKGLDNVLTVEGHLRASTDDLFTDRICAGDSFSQGGNISGVGDVFRAGGFNGMYAPFGGDSSAWGGSSAATPQVAAVAAMVWTVAPELSVKQLTDVLLKTRGEPPARCEETTYSPPVDAYAALLAADSPEGTADFGTLALRGEDGTVNAPVRLALLDVAKVGADGLLVEEPDGKFTQADVMAYLMEFEQRAGQHDYSRFDLNGNGMTGEEYGSALDTFHSARFDLNGDLQWTTAAQTVEGFPVTFNESAPTDLEVLVYYAYSPIYTGNELERVLLLAPYLENLNATQLLLNELSVGCSTQLAPSIVQGPYNLNPPGVRFGTINTTPFPTGVVDKVMSFGCDEGTPLFGASVNNLATAFAIAPQRWTGSLPSTWTFSSSRSDVTAWKGSGTRCSKTGFFATIPSTGEYWTRASFRFTGPPTGDATAWAGQARWDMGEERRSTLGKPDLLAESEVRATPVVPSTYAITAERLETYQDSWGLTGDVPTGAGIPYAVESHPEFVEHYQLNVLNCLTETPTVKVAFTVP